MQTQRDNPHTTEGKICQIFPAQHEHQIQTEGKSVKYLLRPDHITLSKNKGRPQAAFWSNKIQARTLFLLSSSPQKSENAKQTNTDED